MTKRTSRKPKRTSRSARRRALRGTSMLPHYWSVVIPFSEKRTQWHPTERAGSFSTLVRGAFKSKVKAEAWAHEHLGGQPYRLTKHVNANPYGRRPSGDPRWMIARYDGHDDEGRKVKKGDEVLYWPSTKRMQTGDKAKDAWRRFLSEKGDEEGTPYASNPRRNEKKSSTVQAEAVRKELAVLLQDAPVGHIVDIRKLPKRLQKWIPHFHAVGVHYGNRTLLRTDDPKRPSGHYHPYLYVIGRDLTRNARRRRSR